MKSNLMQGSGDHFQYREGVGIMLINNDKKIFVAQRIDYTSPTRQMPQGGIDKDETPECAARRELLEEIGTNNISYLAEITEWLYYDLPEEIATQVWQGRYKGQKQRWFAFKFLGDDKEINVNTAQPEFSHWQWATANELVDHAIFFKRKLYQYLVNNLYNKLS